MSFDFDLTAPFQPEFSTKDQSELRHKVRPVQASLSGRSGHSQVVVPSSSNPGRFRLNESALNSVLGHNSIANKKVSLPSSLCLRESWSSLTKSSFLLQMEAAFFGCRLVLGRPSYGNAPPLLARLGLLLLLGGETTCEFP